MNKFTPSYYNNNLLLAKDAVNMMFKLIFFYNFDF